MDFNYVITQNNSNYANHCIFIIDIVLIINIVFDY